MTIHVGMRYRIKERLASVHAALNQKWRWIGSIYAILSLLDFLCSRILPQQADAWFSGNLRMIPLWVWCLGALILFSLMLLEYATSLRLRPYKAFLEFLDTMLQGIDVLLRSPQLDFPQAKRDTLKIHKAILKALGNEMTGNEGLKRNRRNFVGRFNDLQRVNNGESPLTEEQKRATLRELRRAAERIGDSSSLGDLLPEFDVSALKRIAEEG